MSEQEQILIRIHLHNRLQRGLQCRRLHLLRHHHLHLTNYQIQIHIQTSVIRSKRLAKPYSINERLLAWLDFTKLKDSKSWHWSSKALQNSCSFAWQPRSETYHRKALGTWPRARSLFSSFLQRCPMWSWVFWIRTWRSENCLSFHKCSSGKSSNWIHSHSTYQALLCKQVWISNSCPPSKVG